MGAPRKQRRNLASVVRGKELALEVMRMRLAGDDVHVISRTTGTSPDAIRRLVKAHLEQLDAKLSETIEESRRLEEERLDALQRAFWNQATERADKDAAGIVLKVMERRAKLKGHDAATRVSISSETHADEAPTLEVVDYDDAPSPPPPPPVIVVKVDGDASDHT
jgi:hypothetical protein